MRRYVLNIKRADSQRVAEALKSLDGHSSSILIDTSRGFQRGERRLSVEKLMVEAGHVEALIRVSYILSNAKCWSDVYRLDALPHAETLLIVVKRLSGMGRTDPDLIIDLIARFLAMF